MKNHKFLIILDSLRIDSFFLAKTPNIDKFRNNRYILAWSIGCFTIPSIIGYLLNYPPIQLERRYLFKGISPNNWIPLKFKEMNYLTTIYSGHPWILLMDKITEGWFLKYFDRQFTYYPQDDMKLIVEDIKKSISINPNKPVFGFVLSYKTHFPFKGKYLENMSYEESIYAQARNLEEIDEELEDLFNFLKTQDRDSDIIITADHADVYGGPVGIVGHNPAHMKKWNLDLIQIPFITGTIKHVTKK